MKLSATYTDLYELTMAQVYFSEKNNEVAIFDYFFRSNPFDGGYTVFSGLESFLTILKDFTFTNEDLAFLKTCGFTSDFMEYLKNFKFTGNIYGPKEGEIVFPNEPVLIVEAPIIEAQILETLLLNTINFQSLIATKARRIREVAPKHILIDMGLRRAQGVGGYYASRAAVIGGFNATSNVIAGRDFNLETTGTMAHAFIQSYESELQAFRDFAKHRPKGCVLLLDTYDTLKSGLPNAIKVAKEMKERGEKLLGVRLDSGDLAFLSKKCRETLDQENLRDIKIVASNSLDEWVIKSLLEQNAPIDVFGIGTKVATGHPDSALDGVYKLAHFKKEARIKISNNTSKVTLPGKKQVYRVLDEKDNFYGADLLTFFDEELPNEMHHPVDINQKLDLSDLKKIPLLENIILKGERVSKKREVKEIEEYSRSRLLKLPSEYKRFDNPHIYKVGISKSLKNTRDELILKYRS